MNKTDESKPMNNTGKCKMSTQVRTRRITLSKIPWKQNCGFSFSRNFRRYSILLSFFLTSRVFGKSFNALVSIVLALLCFVCII